MAKIKAFIHGVYPRSSDLIQVSRDLIRKRGTEDDYLAQFKKDFDGLSKLQKSLDLDFVEDGKLGWHDLFRPIVMATEGFETGALTRWFDNNTFFRQPILKGSLKLDEKKLDKFFPVIKPAGKWKVTLPSPYTFSRLLADESGQTFENTLAKITELMKKVVVYLDNKGVDFIQFNEAYIPYAGANNAELKLFKNSLSAFEKVLKGKTTAYHFYFGDAGPVLKSLGKIDFIDIIGVDFYKTAISSLPKDFPYSLAAGVVDGRNSLLEDEGEIKKFIKAAEKFAEDKEIYITNNSDLDLLPESIARKKVELLAKVRDSFK